MMPVFAWGLGKNGQLGNGKKQNETTPHLIKFEKAAKSSKADLQVCNISAGGLFTCVLTKSGDVYSFGCGKYGRLGTGDELDRLHASLITIPDSERVIMVSCGLWHACVVDTSGTLYSWGYNKTHNVLAHAQPQSIPFEPPFAVSGLNGIKIVGVSCGINFTLAWDADGKCYSWGYGKHGVLGQGNEDDYVKPTVIEGLTQHAVVYMNAGFSHCGAVTNNGNIYMFGQGKCGAIGLGDKNLNDMNIPTLLPHTEEIQFKEISCSVGEHHGHTLAVTTDGRVYSWGDGYKGKLGHGNQESKFTATEVPAGCFNNEAVVHVSAGGIHSTAVSAAGKVYTWGCGSDGRLGHPEAQGHRYLFRSDTPRHVEALKGNAVQVSASYYHTAALTH